MKVFSFSTPQSYTFYIYYCQKNKKFKRTIIHHRWHGRTRKSNYSTQKNIFS